MVKWWKQVETNKQNTLVNANTCTVLITFTNNLWPIWVSEMLEIHLEWKVLNASSVLFDSYVDNIIEGFFFIHYIRQAVQQLSPCSTNMEYE